MAIIETKRLDNANDRSVIIQRVDQRASGDVAYIIYPSAGVSRFGAGDATFQFFKGDATNVIVALSMCGLSAIKDYLADQAESVPVGIQEPKFVVMDTLTADTFKQYPVPFTVMKLTFTGVGVNKAAALLGVA